MNYSMFLFLSVLFIRTKDKFCHESSRRNALASLIDFKSVFCRYFSIVSCGLVPSALEVFQFFTFDPSNRQIFFG